MRLLLRYVRPEQLRELTLVLIIIAVAAFFATQIPDFLSARTFTRISTSVAVIAVVAVGQTLVVLTRNIDLSVGSIVGLVAYFAGTMLSNDPTIPAPVVIAISIAIGAVLGAVNGLLVAYGGVPAIVTTLGTLALYRVALVELSGAKTVTTDALPAWMLDLPRVTLVSLGAIDVRPLVVLAVVIAVVFQLGLRYLPVRPAPVRDRLQPGGRAGRRLPGPARRLRGVRAVRSPRGPRRVHVPGALREHHRHGRPGPRAAGRRRRRGRRREHLRRRRARSSGPCSGRR